MSHRFSRAALATTAALAASLTGFAQRMAEWTQALFG